MHVHTWANHGTYVSQSKSADLRVADCGDGTRPSAAGWGPGGRISSRGAQTSVFPMGSLRCHALPRRGAGPRSSTWAKPFDVAALLFLGRPSHHRGAQHRDRPLEEPDTGTVRPSLIFLSKIK